MWLGDEALLKYCVNFLSLRNNKEEIGKYKFKIENKKQGFQKEKLEGLDEKIVSGTWYADLDRMSRHLSSLPTNDTK